MHHQSNHTTLAFLAIVLLVAVSLACNPTGALSGGGAQGQPTQPPGAPTAAAGAPTATTGAQAKPTATTASGAPVGGLPQLGDLKSLSSYRSTTTMKTKDEKGQDLASVITTEWVKDQKAEHTTMKDAAGKTTSEIITIGDKRWVWMPTLGWREMPPSPDKPGDLPSDLESQIKKMQSDMSQAKPTFTQIGTETINGVRCRRYKYDMTLSLDMPNLPTGGTQKVDIHSNGEVWIADQSGLPAIIIQSKETSEITLRGIKTVTESERKVYDINAAITIKPPEGAAALPGAPVTTAVATRPVQGAATPTKPAQAAGATPTKPAQSVPGGQTPPTMVPAGQKTVNLTIRGTDAIYLAGRVDVKIPPLDTEDEAFPLLRCSGEMLETFPASIAVSPGAQLTFKVSGSMDFWGGTSPTGPDGDGVSAIEAVDGLSGYTGPQGALVGVFLNATNPKGQAAPEDLDMESLGTDFATLSPALGQVFFIGDGLTDTGKGASQKFIVPRGATRFFVGIADASGFGGQPGCYGDNLGTFQVQMTAP